MGTNHKIKMQRGTKVTLELPDKKGEIDLRLVPDSIIADRKGCLVVTAWNAISILPQSEQWFILDVERI